MIVLLNCERLSTQNTFEDGERIQRSKGNYDVGCCAEPAAQIALITPARFASLDIQSAANDNGRNSSRSGSYESYRGRISIHQCNLIVPLFDGRSFANMSP
jgi:hypothetical protein